MLCHFQVSSKGVQLYVMQYVHSSRLFPIYIITEYWVEFCVLYSRSLFIYFTSSGVCVLILSF